MYIIHGKPNELEGLPLWLGSKKLFYFKNTVISFVGGWKCGCEQLQMSACLCRHNNVVAKAKKIKCHFFLSLGVLLNVEAKTQSSSNQKKQTNKQTKQQLHQAKLLLCITVSSGQVLRALYCIVPEGKCCNAMIKIYERFKCFDDIKLMHQ